MRSGTVDSSHRYAANERGRRSSGGRESTLEEAVKTWQGRRVFLTGHTGFKGSWLALWLNRLGAKVRGYALDPCTEPNMFNLASVGAVVDDIRGDIRDYAKLEASMTRVCAGSSFSSRGAAHRSALICRPARHICHERHGHGASAGSCS